MTDDELFDLFWDEIGGVQAARMWALAFHFREEHELTEEQEIALLRKYGETLCQPADET